MTPPLDGQHWTTDLSQPDVHAVWEADRANHALDDECPCMAAAQPFPGDPTRNLYVHITAGVQAFGVGAPPPPPPPPVVKPMPPLPQPKRPKPPKP
jgi:hypothetical protein